MAKKPNINPEKIGAGLGELKARLLFLLVALIVYRIGTHIPVPGIDPNQLTNLFQQNEGTFLGLFNMFSGGALERMSIVALGIMPYISSSIIMQLLTASLAVARSPSTRVMARWCWRRYRAPV
jgi:preprotein translocase subunit SecY